MRRLAIVVGLILAVGACSERDDQSPDVQGAAGGATAGGASNAGGRSGGPGAEAGAGAAGPSAGAAGAPSIQELSFESFETCDVTPEISAHLSTYCNDQYTDFDVDEVGTLLRALRDRTRARYDVSTYEDCIGEFTFLRHRFVVTPDGIAERATYVSTRIENDPEVVSYETARCTLQDPSAYQACLDTLESGPWPNCAFDLFASCAPAAARCQ